MTNTKKLYDKWIEELESGELTQTSRVLCNEDEEGNKSYCCLGVAAEKVLGKKFQHFGYGNHGNMYYTTPYGQHYSLLGEDEKDQLNLNKNLTVSELYEVIYRLRDSTNEVDLNVAPQSRQAALTYLNDKGASFEEIADFLRTCEWGEEDA